MNKTALILHRTIMTITIIRFFIIIPKECIFCNNIHTYYFQHQSDTVKAQTSSRSRQHAYFARWEDEMTRL